MRIAFVVLGAENLGVEYLSSVLKKEGHQTKLVFDPGLFNESNPTLRKLFSHQKKVIEAIGRIKPHLVGFSVVTDNYRWVCEVAREVKGALKVPIIFGGYHASAVPEEVISNDFVDMVCIGEGEEAIVELVNGIDRGRLSYDIKNIWFKDKERKRIIKNPVRALVQDLDRLPYPDKSLYEENPLMPTKYMILTTRGCPFNCTFCGNSFLHKLYHSNGRALRRRSIENVLDELRRSKAIYNYKAVMFTDDCFGIDRKRITEFLRRYKREIDIPFYCNPHLSFVDEEFIYLLKETGCSCMGIGLQTVIEEHRKNILNRPEKNSQLEFVLQACKGIGLKVQVDHIVGFPFEGEEEQRLAVNFYNRIRPEYIHTCWFAYYPGTTILEIAREKGWVTKDEVKSINEGKITGYRQRDIIKDRNQRRTFICRNFLILFKLLPLFPQRLIRYVTVKRLYRFFNLMPYYFIDLFNIITMIKMRDHWIFAHYRHFFYQLMKSSCIYKKKDSVR